MKLLTNKKYYELTAKIYDQEQELTRKNTEINTLKSRCDLVSKHYQETSEVVEGLISEKNLLIYNNAELDTKYNLQCIRIIGLSVQNTELAEQNQQLSAKVSELEPIVEKFNHKKNLEKARKQKYRSKLRLRKKESTKTVMPVVEMSEAEKFARENAGKEIRHRTYVGYIVGYNIEEDVENDYVLIGFKDGSGWYKTSLTENDVFVVDTPMKEYETYWYFRVEDIILK